MGDLLRRKSQKSQFPWGVSGERVCECVLLTLFHFPPTNISKYFLILPFLNICKYFPPPNIFHRDPCDIQPPLNSAVHKNYFRTSFATCFRLSDTHANVISF